MTCHRHATTVRLLAVLVTVGWVTALVPAEEPKVATSDSMIGKEAGEVRDDNGLKMKLVWCPPGVFNMEQVTLAVAKGAPRETVAPVKVILTHGFWLGKCEVTQEEWNQTTTPRPWKYLVPKPGDHFPAVTITWKDAMQFCRHLTERERTAGRLPNGWEYTLPTEAQWERACRARTQTRYGFGDDPLELGEYGWCWENAKQAGERYPHEVGQKKPTRGVFTTCMETCSNGAATTMPRRSREAAIRSRRTLAWTEWCAVAAGPHSLRAAARIHAYGLPDRPATTTLASASPSFPSGRRSERACLAPTPAHDQRYNPGMSTPVVTTLANRARLVVSLLALGACLSPPATKADEPPPAEKPAADSMLGKEAGDVRDDNGLKMKMMWCPHGKVTLGDEKNVVHAVLTHGYWLARYEVTQGEWKQIMASDPWKKFSAAEADDLPATFIGWQEAMEFCRKLTEQERQANRLPEDWEYTLPTEAQWESACRARTETRFCFGDDASKLGDFAWFSRNTRQVGPHPVGQKRPNDWGLHDMHGNVSEWCRDYYATKLPGGRDPETVSQKWLSYRVIRGGSWLRTALDCGSAARKYHIQDTRTFDTGFRVALTPVQPVK